MRNRIFLLGGMVAVMTLFYGCGGQTQTADTLDTPDVRFKKHVLTQDFISEGVALGDVNRDGLLDVMAGAYWFQAPDWSRHEIFAGKTFDGSKEYSNSFLNYSMDVNQDGWVDLVLIGFPGTPASWYENPRNASGHWKKHVMHEEAVVGNESPAFVDVDGDGRNDLLFGNSKVNQMVWLRAPLEAGDTTWTLYTISGQDAPGTSRFSHGLGFGDVNGDGINDVVVTEGWWEGPDDPIQPDWNFHTAALGEDCSQMHIFDVNDDGLSDVISASAHHYGIWWHEQKRNDAGEAAWTTHMIDSSFSQSHASILKDIDLDGHPDLVVGKRYYAHNDSDLDPGRDEPAVLYWIKLTPGEKPYFHLHLIDDDSGAGLNVAVDDYNGDGLPDIAVANKKGVFLFERIGN